MDIEWGRQAAKIILAGNPDLQLHQMHDPVQDRLMVSQMGYFRLKRRNLGRTYRQFLENCLAPGGTIWLCDCSLSWPVTHVGPQHYFQVGGLGDVSPQEYLQGSSRVEEFLSRHRSQLRCWKHAPIDANLPEAEWGFLPELGEDVQRFAAERGFRVKRIIFDHPENLSAPVADLHQWWYNCRGFASSRLLIECFAYCQPYIALRTRTIPLWVAFNTEKSLTTAEDYVSRRDPFAEIYVMLFSNVVKGIGLTPINRWQAILDRAQKKSAWIGTNPAQFPTDIGSFVRFHADLKKQMTDHLDPPLSLSLAELEEFFKEHASQYRIKIESA